MEIVYVIGHVNPDTDSIAAAIGYAWCLCERDGVDAIPARRPSRPPKPPTIGSTYEWLLSLKAAVNDAHNCSCNLHNIASRSSISSGFFNIPTAPSALILSIIELSPYPEKKTTRTYRQGRVWRRLRCLATWTHGTADRVAVRVYWV